MADVFSKEKRSWIMSRVTGKNTKPEMIVRKLLHAMGYRYRLHVREMPGKPDIVLKRRKKAIFVHGCFWHGHKGCKRSQLPATNMDFWKGKIERNIERDKKATANLENMGWDVLVIWECETKDTESLKLILLDFLDEKRGISPNKSTTSHF